MTESECVPPYGLWPRSEFQLRWARAHELMAKQGFDALIITNPINWHWLTGALIYPEYMRRYVAILPKDGEPIALVRQHHIERIKLSTFLKDIRGQTVPPDAPAALAPPVVEILKEIGVEHGRIGAEMTAPYTMGIMYDEFEAIKGGLPSATFLSCSRLFVQLRVVKSQREIEAIRKACQITDRAHEAIPDLLRRGMNHREAADLLICEMTRRGGFSPFVFVRDGTERIPTLGTWKGYKEINADRPLRDGYLLVDLGCNYNNYWSDFSRHYWIGSPPEKAKKYAKASIRAIEKSLQMTKPGARGADIIVPAYREIENVVGPGQLNGMKREYAFIGHTIGLDMVDGLTIGLDTTTPLQEGMTLAYEPTFFSEYGYWIPEVDCVVTKEGYDLLSSYPIDLVQI